MKAIILAAGKGSRLYQITSYMPKCLIDIGGKTLIEREIEILHKVGVEDITVVTGHFAHMVEELLGDKVDYVFNPFYAMTNSLASLWFAKEKTGSEFIYLHSDIIFESSVIRKMLLDQAEVCLAVEKKGVDEEDMKVRVEGERIAEINKAIPLDKAYGEFIGIAKFKGGGVHKLRKALDKIMRTGDVNAYFEAAVQDLIVTGKIVNFMEIGDSFYAEIDYIEDIEKAEEKV